MPKYLERELRRFLTCGVVSKGFTRIRCTTSGEDMLVAFSCGTTTICPSCAGLRTAASATHLADKVLPAFGDLAVPTLPLVATLLLEALCRFERFFEAKDDLRPVLSRWAGGHTMPVTSDALNATLRPITFSVHDAIIQTVSEQNVTIPEKLRFQSKAYRLQVLFV